MKLAYEVPKTTIKYFEGTEFDEKYNLFRGSACYDDGIVAYPDVYAKCGKKRQMRFKGKRIFVND